MTTFLKITNKDIYEKLNNLVDNLEEFKKINLEGHEQIIKHQIKTNGKVKLNRWIATTCLTLIIALIGVFKFL